MRLRLRALCRIMMASCATFIAAWVCLALRRGSDAPSGSASALQSAPSVSHRRDGTCTERIPASMLTSTVGNETLQYHGDVLHQYHGDELHQKRAAAASHIPQHLWATARSPHGHALRAACAFHSWAQFNPSYVSHFVDDVAMNALLAEHYGAPFMERFKALPLGVLKADFFRCASTSVWLCDLCTIIL
jgi:hypothetical protein